MEEVLVKHTNAFSALIQKISVFYISVAKVIHLKKTNIPCFLMIKLFSNDKSFSMSSLNEIMTHFQSQIILL